ncbi:MAG: hypothetical protein ACHQ9S_16970 [Candidatus Binatia bacterium]
MLRLRFLPGLILGVILGLPAGVVIALLILPSRGADVPVSLQSQVPELTRRLEAANEARERADHQFEQFQKLAEQMTSTFNSLEMRFKLLEEEQHVRDAQGVPAAARQAAAPAPPQAPTASKPEAAARPAGDAPPPAPEQDPSAPDQPSPPSADDSPT